MRIFNGKSIRVLYFTKAFYGPLLLAFNMKNVFVCGSCGNTLTLKEHDKRRPTKCTCTRAAWMCITNREERELYDDLRWLEQESQLDNQDKN